MGVGIYFYPQCTFKYADCLFDINCPCALAFPLSPIGAHSCRLHPGTPPGLDLRFFVHLDLMAMLRVQPFFHLTLPGFASTTECVTLAPVNLYPPFLNLSLIYASVTC